MVWFINASINIYLGVIYKFINLILQLRHIMFNINRFSQPYLQGSAPLHKDSVHSHLESQKDKKSGLATALPYKAPHLYTRFRCTRALKVKKAQNQKSKLYDFACFLTYS